MLMAARVDDKFMSEALGHASVSFTKDVYGVVAEELAEDSARKISAFISRPEAIRDGWRHHCPIRP